MKRRSSFLAVMTVFACGMMLVSGCRTKGKTKKGYNEDALSGTPVNTDVDKMDMGTERTADGVPVAVGEFEPVYFAYDSFQLDSSELPKIEKAAEFLKNNPDVHLVMEGHTDERGSNEYNMSLGENRAQAVRAAMVSAGIDASLIQTRSFGEEKPVDPEHGEEAWRKNRRGEFLFFR